MSDADKINADLTEEEQAAMAELEAQMADTDADDPLFDPSAVVTDAGTQEDQQQAQEQQQATEQEALTPEQEQEKADADEAAAAQKKIDDDAAAAAAEAAKPQEEAPARAPILVAEAPEGAEARLAEIATAKAELGDKFDDGDLTSKEYQAELDKLSKEERTLERAIDKAQIAQDLENQRITNERMNEINTFLKEVEIPHDPKNLRFRVLDAAVRDVANDEANVNLSAREVMQKAYDLCIAEGALVAKKAPAAADDKKTDPPAKTAPAKTPINAPPSLANLPASEVTSTEDNRFAYLNRITDPDKREAAFAKLSAADQEAYLATGG
jgi:hypothetical protein